MSQPIAAVDVTSGFNSLADYLRDWCLLNQSMRKMASKDSEKREEFGRSPHGASVAVLEPLRPGESSDSANNRRRSPSPPAGTDDRSARNKGYRELA